MIDEDEDRSRKASISCLTLDSIEKYDVAQGKPIKYRNTCSVMFLQRHLSRYMTDIYMRATGERIRTATAWQPATRS